MQNPWKLPKPSYKYTNTAILITAHTQKTATVNTTNIKRNIFWSISGGWYKELKIITFCVFDWMQLLLFNGLLKNNYFTKHILQKTSLKNTCLRYLFLSPRWLSFIVLCIWWWWKSNKKQPLTATMNKTPKILLTIYFQKMKKWIK